MDKENQTKPSLQDFIGNKFWYENATVFTIRENGHCQPLVDIRGFGAIQNLFKDNKGEVDLIAANNFQDDIGEYIKEAIENHETLKAENAKLKGDEEKMGELLKEMLAYKEERIRYRTHLDQEYTGQGAILNRLKNERERIQSVLQAAGTTE